MSDAEIHWKPAPEPEFPSFRSMEVKPQRNALQPVPLKEYLSSIENRKTVSYDIETLGIILAKAGLNEQLLKAVCSFLVPDIEHEEDTFTVDRVYEGIERVLQQKQRKGAAKYYVNEYPDLLAYAESFYQRWQRDYDPKIHLTSIIPTPALYPHERIVYSKRKSSIASSSNFYADSLARFYTKMEFYSDRHIGTLGCVEDIPSSTMFSLNKYSQFEANPPSFRDMADLESDLLKEVVKEGTEMKNDFYIEMYVPKDTFQVPPSPK